MKRKILIFTIISATLLSITIAASAQDRPYMRMNRLDNLAQVLELTDSQKAEIDELTKDFRLEVATLRNELQSERLALRSLQRATNPDQKAIYAQIDKMSELRSRIQKRSVDHRMEIRNVLSEDQKTLFDAMPRRMLGRRDGYGRMGGRPYGQRMRNQRPHGGRGGMGW